MTSVWKDETDNSYNNKTSKDIYVNRLHKFLKTTNPFIDPHLNDPISHTQTKENHHGSLRVKWNNESHVFLKITKC